MQVILFKDMDNFQEDICLIDSGTAHTIFKDTKYFSHLNMGKINVTIIFDSANLIEGFKKTIIILSKETKLIINNAMFSPKSWRNLLSFKNIRENGYHIKTFDEMDLEYLGITKNVSGQTCVIEKFPTLSFGLYWTNICAIEAHSIVNQKFSNSNAFALWHDLLGHSGSIMMRRIIENSNRHPLKNLKVLSNGEISCNACYQGKLIVRP